MKRVLVLMLLIGFSSLANAQPVVGAGLLRLSSDYFDLHAIYITGGYRFDTGYSDFTVTPELRLAIGTGYRNGSYTVVSTSFQGYMAQNLKLKRLYGLGVRGNWRFNNLNVYIEPHLVHYIILSRNVASSFNSSKFTVGFGVGYRLSRQLSVEGSMEHFTSKQGDNYTGNIYSVGLSYHLNP